MKKRIVFLIVFAFGYSVSIAQLDVPYFGKIQWISGYHNQISGENIGYFSAYPDYATTALLTRCTDGNKIIEWETDPVPKNIKGKYVYFSWVAAHSSGTSKDKRNFDLYVNDEKLLTFSTFPGNTMPNWSYAAPDSSRIVFQQTKRDASDDAHGLVFLRLQLSKLKPGLPVKLKVVGQAQSSNDWYMTFKFSFEEKVDITPMPFLLKNGMQSLLLTALHFGKDEQLQVNVGGKKPFSFIVKNGMNSFDIPVDAVRKDDSVFVKITSGKKVVTSRFVLLKPVVYREIYFIHHSHTDIGYSHLQPEVLRIHMKNIDDALRMIDATSNFSEEAKFKWNIESLWVVENYLKQASPAQKNKFIDAVKKGSICLSGLYANILTGISEPEEVFHYTDYAVQLRNQYGVQVKSAMISDIPGYAWATVTGFAKGGIKYFSSGPNYLGETHPYLGDRVGWFVKTWGDKPVWWTSPSGEEKILFWTAGKGYSSWHGTAAGGIFDKGPKKIAAYLNELSEKKYPYDMVQWRYNIVSDNGPLDTTISNFVEHWNKKYASPKIILSTTEKLFEKFEKKYGNELPVVKGDITPYWEDGAFSTALEEGENRINSLRLQQLQTLYSLLSPSKYDSSSFYEAWKNVLLFHEHTWGAYNSISEPDIPFVTKQWEIKKQFLLDAGLQVNKIQENLFNPAVDKQSNKIIVVNTASWKRTGPVEFETSATGQSVKNAQGKKLPLQKLSNGKYVFIAEDVPALGTAAYEMIDEKLQPPNNFRLTDSSISNGMLSLQWDAHGSINKLLDNSGFNYAGAFNKQGLNSYWYVAGLDPSKAESNGAVQMRVKENGPVVTTIELRSSAPGSNSLTRSISLYAGDDEIFIDNILDKKSIREKESVHFGFPFNSVFTKTTIDAGYGSMQYLADQLPGSNLDYLYARRWLDASGNRRGIQWMIKESPLVEPGTMIDERKIVNQSHKEWKRTNEPTATWFSYVMNNYWHTNYKADQDGVSHFQYALKPHGMFDYSNSEKAAFEFTQPMKAFVAYSDKKFTAGLFELTNNRIIVTSVTPVEENSFIIRLYNPEPSAEETGFTWKDMKPEQIINLKTGQAISGKETILLGGMSVAEYKLVKARPGGN